MNFRFFLFSTLACCIILLSTAQEISSEVCKQETQCGGCISRKCAFCDLDGTSAPNKCIPIDEEMFKTCGNAADSLFVGQCDNPVKNPNQSVICESKSDCKTCSETAKCFHCSSHLWGNTCLEIGAANSALCLAKAGKTNVCSDGFSLTPLVGLLAYCIVMFV